MFSKGLLKEYSFSLSVTARFLDVFAVLIGAVLAFWWRFDNFEISVNYRTAILLAIIFTPLIFDLFGSYDSWREKSQLKKYRAMLSAWLSVVLLLFLIAFLAKITGFYSRQWIVAWFICSAVLLILFRFLFTNLLHVARNKGWNTRRIVIFGSGVLGESVQEKLKDAAWSGIKINAYFDDNSLVYNNTVNDIPILGGLDELIQYMDNNLLDEIWITLPLRAEERVRQIMDALKDSTITIRYVPDIFGFRLLNHSVSDVAGIPVINVSTSPMVGGNRLIKAMEDRLGALLIILIVSPVLLVISLAIKFTSHGPILFKQKRHGWDGKKINVYKFRTMVVHTEEEGKVTQASVDDSRITKLGAFLRKTSLDELPQFFNVLQGRMSIVGPRPHAIAHNEQYKELIDSYMKRHKVKPGITGWAQINGYRGETDTLDKMEKRVEYDLFYIENWSVWFDLNIIIRTVFHGFVDKNAY